MNLHRLLTVAAMHGRDLSRRRLALIIVTPAPTRILFLLRASASRSGDAGVAPAERAAADMWVVATGAIGVGWSIAVAALFVLIGSRRADQSLLFAGYRPTELLMGRVLTVLGLAAVIAPLSAVVIWSQRDLQFVPLLASIGLSALVAAAIGVLAAALVPREMEGVLLIIGIIGVQMTANRCHGCRCGVAASCLPVLPTFPAPPRQVRPLPTRSSSPRSCWASAPRCGPAAFG